MNVEMPYRVKVPDVSGFSLIVDQILMNPLRNFSIIEYRICAKWLLTAISPSANLSVIEVDIPTGTPHSSILCRSTTE